MSIYTGYVSLDQSNFNNMYKCTSYCLIKGILRTYDIHQRGPMALLPIIEFSRYSHHSEVKLANPKTIS